MAIHLTTEEKQFLIQKIAAGEAVPNDFRERLFPTTQKEYELCYAGKMRREDLLADQDGTFAVPLQTERVFKDERESFEDGWRNMIVFGDNLQFLKTCYANKDELIRNRVKGKVKLIYIDPPFATEGDFKSGKGQKAYSDRVKGSSFVEFLRRRIVLARELLSPDGCIFVHLDYRYKNHLRVLLDEVFGETNFKNEIAINRIKKNIKERIRVKKLNEEFDSILLYSKSELFSILPPTRLDYKPDRWHGFDASGIRQGMDYDLFGYKPPANRHWSWEKTKALKAIEHYRQWERERADSESPGDYYRRKLKEGEHLQFLRASESTGKPEYFIPSSESSLCNNLWNDLVASSFDFAYPTEKNEKLLHRVIESTTEKDDMVLDFFGGSGTTAAVAEKSGRRWITCDIGKLAFYTMQKRLLTIQDGKSLTNPKSKYSKPARAFVTVNTGLYDLEKLNALNQDKYVDFVLNLFEVERKPTKIKGVQLHGERKDGYNVMVWEFWKQDGAQVDETYLEQLHEILGKRVGDRLYIIAPANAVQFIGDYYEINSVRYYFLKIPYQVIKELHRAPFAKFRQPQSKAKINDLENAIGFHFMRQPEVEARFADGKLYITRFHANSADENGGGKPYANFETLAMLVMDENYNGKEFVMTSAYFAADLVQAPLDETDDGLQEQLKRQTQIIVPLKSHGDTVITVFVDIFGNEFKQEIKTR